MSIINTKYHILDYVLIGWQDDDLPRFGRIDEILVIKGNVMFIVHQCETVVIERHFHSFLIKNEHTIGLYWYSELFDFQSFQGHVVGNSHLYITFRSQIEKC